MVLVVEFAVEEGLMTERLEASTFPFVDFLRPLARFAHVKPQYGCTIAPSMYFCLFLQYLGAQRFNNIKTTPETRALTLHILEEEAEIMFGPPTVLGPVGKPGKTNGAAHALEQKR